MNGTVDVVFQSNGSGRILAEDGMRYDFEKSDHPPGITLRKGMQVEFIPSGTDARSISLGNSQPSVNPTSPQNKSHGSQNNSNLERDLPGSASWIPTNIGFVIFGFIAGFFGSLELLGLGLLINVIYIMNRIHHNFSILHSAGGSHGGGLAIGLLFIPYINLLWAAYLYSKWAKEFNRINQRNNWQFPEMPEWIGPLAGVLFVCQLIFSFAAPELSAILLLGHFVAQVCYGHMSIRRAIAIKDL